MFFPDYSATFDCGPLRKYWVFPVCTKLSKMAHIALQKYIKNWWCLAGSRLFTQAKDCVSQHAESMGFWQLYLHVAQKCNHDQILFLTPSLVL